MRQALVAAGEVDVEAEEEGVVGHRVAGVHGAVQVKWQLAYEVCISCVVGCTDVVCRWTNLS